MIKNDEIQHHGVRGMKWGIRRKLNSAFGRFSGANRTTSFINSVYSNRGSHVGLTKSRRNADMSFYQSHHEKRLGRKLSSKEKKNLQSNYKSMISSNRARHIFGAALIAGATYANFKNSLNGGHSKQHAVDHAVKTALGTAGAVGLVDTLSKYTNNARMKSNKSLRNRNHV